MDASKIGTLIAQQRRKLNMTQADLAQILGVTNKAISRWETGRGYPDIEIIPELAKTLDVSIADLLNGEISDCNEVNGQITDSITDICVYAGVQRKKQSRLITYLFTTLLVMVLGIIMATVTTQLKYFYNAVIGSESCIVAADYSSLTYLGKKYVPLPVNGFECRIGDQIVSEARVEGVGFLGKIFFGETIFEVKNVPCDEIVYLQTDYDALFSDYFVLEEKFDFYVDLLESSFDNYYVVGDSPYGYSWERDLSALAVGAIRNPLDEVRIDYKHGLDVRVYEDNHIFFYRCGEVIRSKGIYYWMPYEFIDTGDVHAGYYLSDRYFRLNDVCSDEFDAFFSMP